MSINMHDENEHRVGVSGGVAVAYIPGKEVTWVQIPVSGLLSQLMHCPQYRVISAIDTSQQFPTLHTLWANSAHSWGCSCGE